MTTILCYIKNKLIYKIEYAIREEVLTKMLLDKILFYDTDLESGNFEIIDLSKFDRIIVQNKNLYSNVLKELDRRK